MLRMDGQEEPDLIPTAPKVMPKTPPLGDELSASVEVPMGLLGTGLKHPEALHEAPACLGFPERPVWPNQRECVYIYMGYAHRYRL